MPGTVAIDIAEILPGELDETGAVVLRVIDSHGRTYALTLPLRLLGPLLGSLPTPASPTHPEHTPGQPAQEVSSWSVGAVTDNHAVALTLVTNAGAVERFALTAEQIDSIASLARHGRHAPPGRSLN